MSWTVKGVVARAEKQPAELIDIVIPDPGPNDVVVDIEATGVCHTDLSYRDGGINDEFPFLLGHESAGRVAVIGERVTHVEVGDYVVLNWRAVCGECRACAKGVPQYCFATHNASTPMTLPDGTELTAALGIGSFAEKTLVHEGQCTKVSEDAPAEVAGLLGCGVMAGLGAALNTGATQRGESVAVIGLGGVGCAAIAGAKLAGATTIIGLDVDEKKLGAAEELGATHTLATRGLDPQQVAEKVRELTDAVLADAVEVGAATLAIRASELHEGDFDRIRATGIIPMIWSLRAEEHIRLAVDLGIPWLGADDPARTRGIIEDQLRR